MSSQKLQLGSLDHFPSERIGSGHETSVYLSFLGSPRKMFGGLSGICCHFGGAVLSKNVVIVFLNPIVHFWLHHTANCAEKIVYARYVRRFSKRWGRGRWVGSPAG